MSKVLWLSLNTRVLTEKATLAKPLSDFVCKGGFLDLRLEPVIDYLCRITASGGWR